MSKNFKNKQVLSSDEVDKEGYRKIYCPDCSKFLARYKNLGSKTDIKLFCKSCKYEIKLKSI